jgi:colicin import membrane protein
MARPHATRWLSDQALLGLRELPTNAAWLLSQIQQAKAGPAAAGTREKARKLKTTVLEAAPVGESAETRDGDSVETRMERARAAADRAQEAEAEARKAARAAEESTKHLRELTESNRAWLAEVKRDLDGRAEERIAEAQRAAEAQVRDAQRAAEELVARTRRGADEHIEEERRAARSEADEDFAKVQAEATEEIDGARRDAEAAQQRADEHRAQSRERLADEAVQAARAVAEEAQRQAAQVAKDAEGQPQAGGEEGQPQAGGEEVEAAKQVRVEADARTTGNGPKRQREQPDGNLESRSRAELLDIAASAEIEGRMRMSKQELISAISNVATAAR